MGWAASRWRAAAACLVVAAVAAGCAGEERASVPARTATATPTAALRGFVPSAATRTATAAATPARAPTTSPATVAGVVDGDTIDVFAGGVRQRVRLILIDTPEVYGGAECFGRQASAFVGALLPVGTPVLLERDVSEVDRYQRLLRYVYLADGRMVNEVIVAEGYAVVATFPPDLRYLDRLRSAEATARAGGLGLWSACR